MKHLLYEFGLARWAEQTPDKIAVNDGTRSLTYAQLYRYSRALAAGLRRSGIRSTDILFACVPNSTEFAVLLYAAICLQVPLAAVNPQFRQQEMSEAIRMLHPAAAFAGDASVSDRIRSAAGDIPMYRASFDDPVFSSFLQTPAAAPEEAADLSAPCAMVYTSGVSGSPKYVVRSYGAQLLLGREKIERMHAGPDDTLLISLPLCQQFGQGVLQMGILMGGTCVLMQKFSAERSLQLAEEHQVTLLFGVPTMFIRQMRAFQTMTRPPELSALRTGIVSGAVADPEFLRWFDAQFGCRLLNCYGMTELGCIAMPDYDDDAHTRFETVGRLIGGAELRILDRNKSPAEAGQSGDLFCKTQTMMNGYIGGPLPDGTRDGWFPTGDIGQLDSAQRLVIVGRRKEIMIRGGYNILPAEVERAYRMHPDIADICVVSCPDAELGEKICAFVCLRRGCTISDETLRAYGASHLAKYKLPDAFIRVAKIPHLSTEKYNRRELKRSLGSF